MPILSPLDDFLKKIKKSNFQKEKFSRSLKNPFQTFFNFGDNQSQK